MRRSRSTAASGLGRAPVHRLPVVGGTGLFRRRARYLLWSDIPNNRVLRWDEETGAVSIFRKPSNNANGHTRDRRGRLVACEHDARRVVRFEYDGAITVLADSFEGKPLNSPNDVVVKSDGSVWFTDPTFGILGFYEGHKAESENKPAVYRLDTATGKLTMVADDIPGPNGLAFRPTRKALCRGLARRAASRHPVLRRDGRRHEARQGHGADRCRAGRLARRLPVDIHGNLWCGWGMGSAELDGVRVFNASGKPIGHIDLPERCANLCFGGRYRNRLFMAASHSPCPVRQYPRRGGRLTSAADRANEHIVHGIDPVTRGGASPPASRLSTIGGIGMWFLAVALPAVQADLGVSRADISFGYTMNMLGFAGGVVAGRMVDRRGIVVTSIVSAWPVAGLRARTHHLVADAVLRRPGADRRQRRRHLRALVADVSHWFERRRGLAVAIATSGNYIAGTIWPPIVELLDPRPWLALRLLRRGSVLPRRHDSAGTHPRGADRPITRKRAPPPWLNHSRAMRSACRQTGCKSC